MAFEFGGEPGIDGARPLIPIPAHLHNQSHLVVGHS
jgi:hypothetical protein